MGTKTMRSIRTIFSAIVAILAAVGLTGCYQSALKESPPVRFTQDKLGKPLEDLLGDPKEGVENEPQVEAYPASLESPASAPRSG